MKSIFVTLIPFLLIFLACTDNNPHTLNYYKKTIEQLNDSVKEITEWEDSLKGKTFIVQKNDTITILFFVKRDKYYSYSYRDAKGVPYKLKLFTWQKNDYRVNEIVYLNEDGSIDEENSSYIHAEVIKDSIKLNNPKPEVFSKLKVLIGDVDVFDRDQWQSPDTLSSNNSYLMIPLKYSGKKCVLQTIQTDSKGRDLGGQDYYFDIENLIHRDIKNSLIGLNNGTD